MSFGFQKQNKVNQNYQIKLIKLTKNNQNDPSFFLKLYWKLTKT